MTRQADPGLQPQRTALAWGRTALAMTVNALLLLRTGWWGNDVPLTALGAVLGLVAVGFATAGHWRRRQLEAADVGAPPPALMGGTAAAVMLAAAGGAWAVLS